MDDGWNRENTEHNLQIIDLVSVENRFSFRSVKIKSSNDVYVSNSEIYFSLYSPHSKQMTKIKKKSSMCKKYGNGNLLILSVHNLIRKSHACV